MSLVFHPGPHLYELDGVRVPSVTGILKDSGLIDFSHVPVHILADALDRGRKVHQAIHYYNERDLDVDRFRREFPTYAPYLDAWIAFGQQRRFVPMINEHRVASRRHQVAGTIDCLGILDGRAVLLDFKTGHPDDVAADLQTAAYHALALEWASDDPRSELGEFMNDHPVIRRRAVQLRKDGTFRIEPYEAPTDYREFMALVVARRVVEKRRGECAAVFNEEAA